MKRWRWRAGLPLLLSVLAALPAAAASTAKVSFLAGTAEKEAAGARSPLEQGAALAEGDAVLTSDESRLEILFADQSVLRVGPKARLELTAAHFGRTPEERKLSARLLFGKIWAKVTHVLRGESNFQIETENAVAGVRGTTFRVDAKTDKSVLVRVYAGAVAVARNAPSYAVAKPGEPRREVAGPEEVSRDQWEHLVGKQMEIAIGPDGTPGQPQKFSAASEADDDWVQWNQQRDQARPRK
jgi:hypothetical protein